MTDRITILQLLRLKGRIPAADLGDILGLPSTIATERVDELIEAGLATESNGRIRLTPAGRERLSELLDAERAGVDEAALDHAYHEFDSYNTTLKELMTRWQLKVGNVPNDHSDVAYDSAVIADLLDLHADVTPLLGRIVEQVPRLDHYPRRFDHAVEGLRSGDDSWFARPIADSYHTVWFELHEDLIGLTGRTRAEEAAAGRAL